MSKGSVIVAVSNDLVTDQRVHKVCLSIIERGYDVTLVGRKLSISLPIERSYPTRRFTLPFSKGPLFYAVLNIRLFLFLMGSRCTVIHSNDLDTLPACSLAALLRRKKLVYDTHEYFTEVPELAHNKFAKMIWTGFERVIFPRLKNVMTVNESIAKVYRDKYKVDVKVLRNLPSINETRRIEQLPAQDLKTDKPALILQGAGINIDRGAEEGVEMMKYLPDMVLYIIGAGDVFIDLQLLAEKHAVSEKVVFLPKMPFDKLRLYTRSAQMGLSLDKGTNLNYLYSLPNKLFDYIHAGIPQVVTAMPEVARIVNSYQTGVVVPGHQPEQLADAVRTLWNDKTKLAELRANCLKAREELNWEKESKVLDSFY